MNSEKNIIMPTADFFYDKDAFPEVLPFNVLERFFASLGADPFLGASNGEPVLMLTGLCHHSTSGNHSVICNEKGMCHCFSACGDNFKWWIYAARAWNVDKYEAQNRIKDWLKDNNIDIKPQQMEEYVVLPYEPKHIEPVEGLGKLKDKWYSRFDQRFETMNKLVWHTQDGIDVKTLWDYGVAYYPEHKTIILPHHNINGEIIGMYERYFVPLQKDIKKMIPDIEYKQISKLPHAKYMPLFDPELNKSLSFKNSQNLYGLFKSKKAIKETGTAIIFEGAKSVMLADQWGYHYTVASHTFGASENHISMLIECGAKEIILAFDKQYQCEDENNNEWQLYQKKTQKLAERVKDYVKISRLRDIDGLLDYKDAPVDKGLGVFKHILEHKEMLN